MDLRAIFENRSGRVIAALRVTLTFVFLVALALEPGSIEDRLHGGIILIGAYLLLTLTLLAVSWRRWWLDQWLALPTLLIDIAVFLGAVFVAEGYNSDFTSPFLALFALIVLSCMLRWNWQMAARTGAVVSILFIALGFVLISTHFPIDVSRFSRRAFYMAALLLVLVWFGIDRRGAQVPPLAAMDDGETSEDLNHAALAYALRVTGGTRGILAWSHRDEPWTELYELRADGSATHARVGPAELGAWEPPGPQPRLFHLERGLALLRDRRGETRAVRSAEPIPLALRAGIVEGMAVPLACGNHDGLIVIGGIEGPGPDFLALGEAVACEIEASANRLTAARLEREAAVMRARGAIARDLHDSVAQSLAGACFRLEALRRSLADGTAPAPCEDIAAVRDALRGEQAQVRTMIDTLRNPSGLLAHRSLSADLERSLADAAAHWNLQARFSADGPVKVTGGLSHELRQLLREAVANAARHGQAREVTVTVAHADGHLALVIADDGTGFRVRSDGAAPWSIDERVTALGGRLDVSSSAGGTRLTIAIPLAAIPLAAIPPSARPEPAA